MRFFAHAREREKVRSPRRVDSLKVKRDIEIHTRYRDSSEMRVSERERKVRLAAIGNEASS